MLCAALQHCNQGWPGRVVGGQGSEAAVAGAGGLGTGAGAAVKQVALILSPLTDGRAFLSLS